jgi:hypothetical protein
MAVSGKTAAPHEIPYYLGTDKPPDMAAVTKAIADQAHARLNAIAPKQIVGPTKKQLLIANAAGVVTGVTASGDVTNDESGVFSIGAAKVLEAMLGDGAVTSRKLKPTTILKNATPTEATEAYVDITGLSVEITPAVASTLLLLVLPNFTYFSGSNSTFTGIIRVDAESTAEGEARGLMQMKLESQIESSFIPGPPGIYLIPLSAAKHTIKMTARTKRGGGGAGAIVGANSRFVGLLLAS